MIPQRGSIQSRAIALPQRGNRCLPLRIWFGLASIQNTTEIISSACVSGTVDTHLSSLLDVHSSESTSSLNHGASLACLPVCPRLFHLLEDKGKVLKSQICSSRWLKRLAKILLQQS